MPGLPGQLCQMESVSGVTLPDTETGLTTMICIAYCFIMLLIYENEKKVTSELL